MAYYLLSFGFVYFISMCRLVNIFTCCTMNDTNFFLSIGLSISSPQPLHYNCFDWCFIYKNTWCKYLSVVGHWTFLR